MTITSRMMFQDYQIWPPLTSIFYSYLPNGSDIAQPDEIASNLASLLQANPSPNYVESFARFIAATAHENPMDIATISRVCAGLSQKPEVWTMKVSESSLSNGYFWYNLIVSLGEEVETGLEDLMADDSGNLVIEPNNDRLTAAVLCASCIKHGVLMTESSFISLLREGLQDPTCTSMIRGEEEITLVESCIILAITGKSFETHMSFMFPVPNGVGSALRGLKKKGVLKAPSAIALLERTIEVVEGDFKEPLSENETWELLFP